MGMQDKTNSSEVQRNKNYGKKMFSNHQCAFFVSLKVEKKIKALLEEAFRDLKLASILNFIRVYEKL